MKKILLVLLLIFLGHSAFAMYCWDEVSGQFNHESKMTEKLGASNIVKVSTMLTAAGATLYECKHAQEGANYTSATDDSYTKLYWTYYGYTSATNSTLNKAYTYGYWRNRFYCTTLSTVNGKFQIYGANFEDYPIQTTVSNSASGGPSITKPGVTTGRLYTYIYAKGAGGPFEQDIYACPATGDYGYYCDSAGSYRTYYKLFENHANYYYTHLRYYVLHNPHYTHTFCTTVGGGGGGAAGAAVNYIIKAD